MSVGSLNNMRQECESLREELRVLSEKLLKQHDAALESQVCRSYSLVGRIRTVIYPLPWKVRYVEVIVWLVV